MHRRSALIPPARAALACLLVTIVSCSKNSLAPFQPEVTNAANSFQLQATGVTDVSTTLTYTWSNSGTQATINHATATTAGSTLLVIKDNAGTTVYSKALSASLNDSTATGVAGSWTIQLTLTGFSGTLNFRAQKL